MRQFAFSYLRFCFFIVSIETICFAIDCKAITLTWDANGSAAPNPSDGSGSWLMAGNWWDGSTNVNGNWVMPNPDNAIFGAGVAGAYAVNLGGANVAASNVTFNTSGYVLTNGTLTLPATGTINVSSGQTATINAIVYGANLAQYWNVSANANLNVPGNIQGMQVYWQGGGTLNLSGNNTPAIFWANTQMNQTDGSVTPGAYSFIGYAGGPGVYVLNGPNASLNLTGGDLTIGRAGQSGTLTIQNGAVNVGLNSAHNLNLALDNNTANSATLQVQGGQLNVGASGVGSLINLMPGGGSGGETATLTISGGVVNAQGIQFGSANSYSGGMAQLLMSNGRLTLGNLGIIRGANLPVNTLISLSGGVIAASTNWSSAMPMTLGTTNGDITFQAADAATNAHNITLSGGLTGSGGVIKTGPGTLTLSGTNSYTGTTTNQAGQLAVTTASSGTGAYGLAAGASLNVQVASPGSSLNMASLLLNNGSTLSLDPNGYGNPTVPVISMAGSLTPSGTVTININGASLGVGQFPLIKYGTLGGDGFSAFVLNPVALASNLSGGTAMLVNNTANHSIDLNVSSQILTWDGGVNGNWDLGVTANWKTNNFYLETNGSGPSVVFDDSASGPNTAILLNTNVTPASVVVSNAVLTYSFNGPGEIGGICGLLKQSSGTLTVNNTNVYSGPTLIRSGRMSIAGHGTVSGSPVFEIDGGAALDVSGLSATFALGSSQTLSNGTSPGTICGSVNAQSGGISLAYLVGSPSLTVTNGTLTLTSATMFRINNQGSALPAGSYKVISKTASGAAGSVSGTVPVVSVTGGGIALNAAPSLLLSNNELYLVVSANFVDATFMTNKVMAGYQGWFRTPGDASGNTGWAHWFNGTPVTANLAFDTWPDMSELTAAEKFAVPGFYNPDGSQVYLYSAQIYNTVLRHFQWMQTAGIDGVWLSEFCSHMPGGANESDYPNVTNIMNNVRQAATVTGRTWAFMYDFSGLTSNNVVSVISNQWTRMVDQGVTADPRYMHQNGKPVLLLWSFYENRPQADPQYITPLLDFLQAPGKYQAFMVGGGDTGWRTSSSAFQAMILRMNGWQPWQVGRVSTDSTTGYKIPNTSLWAGDMALCASSNVFYTPVFFSGTQIAGPPPTPPALATVPRRNGNFLWPQFVAASALHINNVFIAMFDECNEGTQIMKSSDTPPTNAPFLTYEGATSDWYLRLVGLGASMLRSGTPVPATLPISPFDTNYYYKIINHATGLVLNNQGSLSSGSPISQYANNNGDPNLHWQIIYDGNGYFTIKSRSSGKVIDIGGATTNGSPVVQTDDIGSDSSKWHFEWDGTGYCRIQSKVSGKSLSTGGATTNFALAFQVTDASTDILRWQILQDATIPASATAPAVKADWTGRNGPLKLSWPTSSSLFRVESTTNLTPPVTWYPFGGGVIIAGGTNSLTIVPDVTNRFFRLHIP